MLAKALSILLVVFLAFLLFTRAGGRVSQRAIGVIAPSRAPRPKGGVEDLTECPVCGEFRSDVTPCVCGRAPTP